MYWFRAIIIRTSNAYFISWLFDENMLIEVPVFFFVTLMDHGQCQIPQSKWAHGKPGLPQTLAVLLSKAYELPLPTATWSLIICREFWPNSVRNRRNAITAGAIRVLTSGSADAPLTSHKGKLALPLLTPFPSCLEINALMTHKSAHLRAQTTVSKV